MSTTTVQLLFEHQLAQEKKARSSWNGKIFSNVAETVYREAKARLISERDSLSALDADLEIFDAWFEYRRYAGDAEDEIQRRVVGPCAGDHGDSADGVEKPDRLEGAFRSGVESRMV